MRDFNPAFVRFGSEAADVAGNELARCPLCFKSGQSADHLGRSALCHKATFAPAAKLRLIGPHPHLVVGSTNHLTSDCSNRSLLSPSAVSQLPLQRQ